MPARYEFTEFNDDRSVGEARKDRGCFVRIATGFVLVFLAIAIAVGVGIIVHFTEHQKLECNFPKEFTNAGTSQTANQQTGNQQGPQSTNQQGSQCPDTSAKPCPVCTQPPTKVTRPSIMSTSLTSLMTSSAPPIKDFRLPRTFSPTEYVLRIQPNMYGDDPKSFTFSGKVEILFECKSASKTVVLHSKQINITSIVFTQTSGMGVAPRYVNYEEDKERQFLMIHLDRMTTPGSTYTLNIDYGGPLTDDLKGFYLSTYKQNGKMVHAGVTQFQPTDARKAFPCFDEPAMKATFKVTLVRKKHQMSLSNMPVMNKQDIGNDFVEDIYQKTVKMSTYLLAFVIGQFKETTQVTPNNLTFGAWTRPQFTDQIQHALDVGTKIITYYEKYFDIKFPLPKQDMIALPDVSFGAMENWGLITYRESAMLYDPRYTAAGIKQYITTAVTHEVAHQWFGNLVTMGWWDDIWLNEGFATYIQYFGADHLYPDWKMMEQFVVEELQDVFEVDALKTSHPVYVPVSEPDEIHQVFDDISYAKGGSVIRMVKFVLGEETFRKGLHKYLNRLKYKNAFHDDLLMTWSQQAIEDGFAINVTEFMNRWILQMNYPVVKVQRQSGTIIVEQSRFLKNDDSTDPDSPSPFGYKWHVPFTFTTNSDRNFGATNKDIHWLKEDKLDIPVPGLTTDDWVLANLNQHGYYRVTYEDSNWNALISQLKTKHTVIPPINRAQIINDAWSLARAGQLSTKIALQTLEYLGKEIDYVPWVAAINQIKYVQDMLGKSGVYGSFKNFIKSIVSDPFKQYGLDDTASSHVESLTRSVLAQMACSYDVESCTFNAGILYQQWMDKPDTNPIGANIKSTVYCSAIANGGIKEWEFLLDQFKRKTLISEINIFLRALACTNSPWILSRYLELTLDSSVIRHGDAVAAISAIAASPIGESLAWDFVRENWDVLFEEYGKGLISFSRLIEGLTRKFNTDLQLQQLETVGKTHPDLGTGSRAFTQAIENTKTNTKWLQQNKDVISDWLSTLGVSTDVRFTDVRLPRHLTPISYELILKPDIYEADPAQFSFEGSVRIIMKAEQTANNVTLHVNKLNISENSIQFGRSDGQQSPTYKDRVSDKKRQFEIFFLNGNLEKGVEYYIAMNFTGPLTGDLAGLYLSQYKRGDKTVYIATTQFESTDARKAFPCFDEPAFKATFKVTLIRKSNMKSISNMPIIGNRTLEDGFVADTYMTSAKMSTYLLAFIICDFEYQESKTIRNVTYRAWSRPEYINQTSIALETGVKVITFYEDYFDIKFPLPKQGMIAIPDFAAGAMENWGLITYRETAMLYEPGVSSDHNIQSVKVTIAHELAHQWFGDLVTIEWWDDLWLNEGFATFVEYMGVDKVSPDWKMFEQFIFEMYDVFEVDSKVTSHPILVPVYTPEEINEIFDTISYSKGACVIRMMRFFLGEKTFQRGLQIYLANRKYSNADHNDLWAALQQQADSEGKQIRIKDVMDTWILQMNFPVVTFTRNRSGEIHIQQDRFLTNKDSKDPGYYNSTFNYVWTIPVTYTTEAKTNFNQTDADVKWMENKNEVISDNSNGWIIGNIQQFGLYRVNYDADNWDKLIKQLKTNYSVIHSLNRGQIINDAFGLAKAKLLPMETALRTLEYLENEDDYVPWVAAGGELGYINDMISDTEIYGAFQDFMLSKVTPLFEKLTMNNRGADHIQSFVRSSLTSKACAYGNEECVRNSQNLFNEYMNTSNNDLIHPALKQTVYCTAVKYGDLKEWQFVYDLYLAATVQAEKIRLLATLSCTRKIWLLKRLLNLALDETIIRKQDADRVYSDVGANPVGKYVAWDFFRSKWDLLYKSYGMGSFALSDIIRGVTFTFNTEVQLQQLKDFKQSHPDMGSGTRAFEQAIESTETNIRWMTENYDILVNWLMPTTHK